MTSNPNASPSACYFCEKPAAIEAGRNSYLVDCPHCGVSYELDLTAWVTRPKDRRAVLEIVRRRMASGYSRPMVTLEDIEPPARP